MRRAACAVATLGMILVACSSSYSGADASDASSGGGGSSGIRCPNPSGGARCPLGAQVCCLTTASPGASEPSSYACRTPDRCDTPAVPFPCSAARDCAAAGKPDTVCCLFGNSNRIVTSVSCVARTGCAGVADRILCDPTAPDCPPDLVCKNMGSGYPSLFACVPP